jgi:hypothetical protein
MLTWAIALSLVTAQVTLDRSGTIDDAVQALTDASGATFKVLEGVDRKEFSVKVAGASFFEALDAVCRAHGKVGYLASFKAPDEGPIELKPLAWVEYPSAYVQDYKVLLTEFAGFTSAVTGSSQQWARVGLVVLGPPWLNIRPARGDRSRWEIDEAFDQDGKDLRPGTADPEPAQRVDFVWHAAITKGNVVQRVVRLKPFDVDKGLKSLKGSAEFTANLTQEVVVPLEVGKTLETPVGTVAVDAVQELDPTPQGSSWKITMSLKAAPGVRTLATAFDPRHRFGGQGLEPHVHLLGLPRDGWTFTAAIARSPIRPESVKILVRLGENKVKVPFAFKDVRF